MADVRNTQTDRQELGGGAGYEAFFDGAALVEHPGRTVLRLSGKNPVEMLNAVLTNDVPKEANSSSGTYAALLSPKGRIQADLRVIKVPGSGDLLVETGSEGAPAVREVLGRYAPFSRVKIEDPSGADDPWGVLGFYGPRSSELLGGLDLAEHESAEAEVGDAALLAVGVAVPVPGLDLVGSVSALTTAREHLLGSGASAAPDAYETARVGAGVPRFGADFTTENFPGECGILERAVSFKKGCYPGQETVARMHYRGHPNKELYRLVVEGPLPEPGTEILQDGKRIGNITTFAPLPVVGRTLDLGYRSR